MADSDGVGQNTEQFTTRMSTCVGMTTRGCCHTLLGTWKAQITYSSLYPLLCEVSLSEASCHRLPLLGPSQPRVRAMQAGTNTDTQQEAESRWQGFAVEQQISMHRWGQRPQASLPISGDVFLLSLL